MSDAELPAPAPAECCSPGTPTGESWLLVTDEDSLFSFASCQTSVLECADQLSRRVTDDESLASQLTVLATLHHQLQQLEALDRCMASTGANGLRALAQLMATLCAALSQELSCENKTANPPSFSLPANLSQHLPEFARNISIPQLPQFRSTSTSELCRQLVAVSNVATLAVILFESSNPNDSEVQSLYADVHLSLIHISEPTRPY
eukprot:TRINITY_DN14003_c0_g2_i2.p1 TRINITY_DN14003_c0_g2~~TRINITY_DN14003_c0_g2_i2.p1  ORF type:complete len:206 (-),score=36.33 TRINITY_DN14003_c0_g2_i2:79-696(-)